VLSEGRLEVGVGLGWMKDEHDIARRADWHRRGEMLDDLLAFLHAWWTTTGSLKVHRLKSNSPRCARRAARARESRDRAVPWAARAQAIS
jgi:alkanesulfonate monooxygenase SsuD/methylene tetrahydromethanopterin reductase-like flavin-dependent oxidoreductase (luciferase family)